MSDNTITVEIRDRVGKGAARAARRTGVVPGVVYGDKKPPQPITVDRKQMDKLLQNPGLFNTLFELHAGDRKQQVLPRDVQLDVVTDVPLHVDFLRLSNTTEITISIPVVRERRRVRGPSPRRRAEYRSPSDRSTLFGLRHPLFHRG